MAASEEYLDVGTYGGQPQQLSSDHGTGDFTDLDPDDKECSSSSSRDGSGDSDADGSSDCEHSPGDGAGGLTIGRSK